MQLEIVRTDSNDRGCCSTEGCEPTHLITSSITLSSGLRCLGRLGSCLWRCLVLILAIFRILTEILTLLMPTSSNKDINELCQGYFRANQNGQQRCILVSEGDNNDNSFHAAKPDFGDLSPIRFQNETMEDDRILTQKAKVFNELILTEERDLSETPLASTNAKHDRYVTQFAT